MQQAQQTQALQAQQAPQAQPARPAARTKPVQQQVELEIFDAAGAVVGRLGSFTVKQLLKGKHIAIVNAEKAVITGDPKGIAERYEAKRGMQNKSDPEHSPKWPRRPDFLYKKIISGMLPKKPRGEKAFKNLRIYVGVPQEFAGKTMQQHGVKEINARFITLEKLCKQLGWKTG